VLRTLPSVAARRPWRSAFSIIAGALLVIGCTDSIVTPTRTEPTPVPPAGPVSMQLTCVASVQSGSVSCSTPATPAGVRGAVTYGGQNQYVKLTSTNVTFDAGTRIMGADVTLQNLLPQIIGSLDSATVHPNGIRVFYASGPTTSDPGTVTVRNPDGTETFLSSPAPYYQWSQALRTNAVSSVKRWEWNVGAGVNTFTFSVYVQTEVTPTLVITEIMANPSAVDDSVGEYIEVYNPGLATVDLSGYRIVSRSGSSTEQVTIASGVTLASRAYGVIAARSNTARNGGVTAIAEWGGTAIQLSNSTSATAPDYVAMRRPSVAPGTFFTMDSVGWAPVGTTTAPPTGRTRELLDVKADNTHMSSAAWNTGYTKYGIGDGNGDFDRGTPGAPNGVLVAPGPVVLVRISPGFAVIDTLNQFRRFSAFPEDSLGQTASTTITWATDNPAIATIDQTGLVTHVDTGQVHITATASNGVADTTLYSIFKYSPASIYRNHVEFGVPVTGLPNDNNNIVILSDRRTHYNLSYNASRGGPNWVSWNLNRTQFGKIPRAPTFYTDPLLVSYGAYQVTTCDYTGSGYTRGHMVQSEQRTQTRAENDTTFLMTNILPQTNELNTGPWGDLEEYGNELARFHQKEIYNVAGGTWPASPQYLTTTCGNANRVQIPTTTWKVMVIMPYGQGLADVTSASSVRVIAVDMPNTFTANSQPWTAYKVTVDQIEAITGYDLLAALPDAIEAAVESSIDP
jgi:DNA/RNA endonuclease G (NUC1)